MSKLRFEPALGPGATQGQKQGQRQKQAQAQLYWEGKALYSATAPEQSAVRKLPSDLEAACLYVLPGPALGYGVAELLERLPATSRVLLLEVEPELAAFSEEYLRDLLRDERLYFQGALAGAAAGGQGTVAEQLIKGLYALFERGAAAWWSFRRVRVLSLNRLYALQRGIYGQLLAWLQHYVQNFWQNRLTLERLGPLWLRNFFCNLAQLPYCEAFGLRGGNLVLAAAGPSLAWHYDWLRREREHFTLLAVDTALLPLLKAGIVPDYVMNLDAQVLNLYDFYGVGALLRGDGATGRSPCLIADLTADPRSFSVLQTQGRGQSQGQASFQVTATRFAESRLWLRFRALLARMGLAGAVPELEPLGSVGVSSVALALHESEHLDFLLLVGYDFAYPKDLHHVRGTSIHERLLQTCGRTRPCNSFAAALRRPLLSSLESRLDNPLEAGFVSDRILWAYAQQLQAYLQAHLRSAESNASALRCARLRGPQQVAALFGGEAGVLPEFSEAEASACLHEFGSGGQSKDNTKYDAKTKTGLDRDRCAALLREFWAGELQILQELESAIVSGRGIKGGDFWLETAFAADYLLRLCPPRAGERQWQSCDWARLLCLSRDFSEQLRALLDGAL